MRCSLIRGEDETTVAKAKEIRFHYKRLRADGKV